MSKYKKFFVALAIVSALMAALIPFDFILSSNESDVITVTEKKELGDDGYLFKAIGKYKYNEDISFDIYKKIKQGDTLRVELSPIFYEPRNIYLVKGESVELLGQAEDLKYFAWMILVFLLPLIIFFPIEKVSWKSPMMKTIWKYVRVFILFMVSFISLIAIIVWIRLILALAGIIDKV